MLKKIIEINSLTKSFGSVRAVDGISFSVGEGQLFALLGVNGAGKSTTISIICRQLKRDSGSVLVDSVSVDDDPVSVKKKLGVVFQNSLLDPSLSVIDNLSIKASLYGMSKVEFSERLEILSEKLSFKNILKRTLGRLSGGQRRRIDIARALIHCPDILILDEPTTGLDPQTRRQLWDVISDQRREKNMTVLLTTHYMEEAADSDYVVIMDSGRIAASGTPLELKNTYTGDFIAIYGKNEDEIKLLGRKYERIPNGFRVTVKNSAEATELIIKHPEIFSDYEISKGKMDDVFLAVTGKKLEGGVANE
ncbi:MAG: ABC transporter ATP-binding protein [Clostridia bacterium]|nr:ABC transporter ATP-binding protein [Clostridia bacterium]